MKWETRSLGAVCVKIGSGVTPKGGDAVYSEHGTSLIRSQNVHNAKFQRDGLAFVNDDIAKKMAGVTVAENDVLLNITGDSVARCCLAPSDVLPARVNQHVLIIRPDTGKLSPVFLAKYLVSPFMQATLLSWAGNGGTRKALTKGMIEALEVPLPDLSTQQRIAAILSAYDDLIENNRRRIGFLEQAARLLYREWFVHLRFPGHETAKIVDGLPEGWRIHLLADLCTEGDGIQTGPFGSQLHQSDYTDTGVPVVMPKDMKENKVDCEGIARIPEGLADKLGRHRMMPGDTVYGRRGDIGRRAFIGKRQNGFFCGTGCLRIRPNTDRINPRYLFETLGSPATSGFIANQAKGSTMANLSAGALKKVPVLCAPDDLQSQFTEIVEPLLETAEILDEQITRLTRARDLLLPRLMDGRIPV